MTLSKSRSYLLISDHPDDATFLAEVSSRSDVKLEVAPSIVDALEYISDYRPIATFLDVSRAQNLKEFESGIQKTFGVFSEVIKPESIHFISDVSLGRARELVRSPFFSNFYERPSINYEQNAETYSRFVQSIENNGATIDSFMNERHELQSLVLNHTSQKQEAVEAFRQYLISAKVPSRISNLIANAMDELIMNALFDAPCDEFGKTLYSSVSRTQNRNLNGRDTVSLILGFDGQSVVARVIDQYGSIDRQRLMQHVSVNYKDKDYMVKVGQAGAGLGLSTVFNSGSSLIYQCDVGQQTQVTLISKIFQGYREFKNQFKYLSVRFNA